MRAFFFLKLVIAASKSSTSIATLVPSGDGFHLIANAADRNRARPDVVFDPNAFSKVFGWFQPEHAFVKIARPFHVGDRDARERDFRCFHDR
jgi:hypothetical protein